MTFGKTRQGFLLSSILALITGSCVTAPTLIPLSARAPSAKTQSFATDPNFMVSSQGYWTSKVAQDILRQGGNAIDAAVAASFMISVERPQSTGLGGGGFMMIYLRAQNKVIALNFRERAPHAATRDMFLERSTGTVISGLSSDGIRAVATPGLVAGLVHAQSEYGRLKLEEVVMPASDRAKLGFVVYPHLANAIRNREAVLNEAAKKVFFKDNLPYKVGQTLKQPDLAETLRAVAKRGRFGFYGGPVGEAILAESEKQRGLLKQEDLLTYTVSELPPVEGTYRNYKIYSMPPPSSGGVHLLQILNTLSYFDLSRLKPDDPQAIHLTVSAMQRAYADRAEFLGDPLYVNVPTQGLISKEYAAKISGEINRDMAQKNIRAGEPWSFQSQLPAESQDTTHLTVVDSEGNMVSTTQTINGWMGSGVMVEGAGFLLNNQMDDFSAKEGVPNNFGVVGNSQNSIHGGKRPLSSMTPTLVLQQDGNQLSPLLALGTPAGSRIINCVALTLINIFDYKMTLPAAVQAPRFHHQWRPDWIEVEPGGFSLATKANLKGRNHEIKEEGIGCKIQAVAKTPTGWIGVADDRGEEGLALGDEEAPLPSTYQDWRETGSIPQD